MIGIGIDVVEVERFRTIVSERPGMLPKLFTSSELEYCNQHADAAPSLSVRFAAKEAVMKALGVGLGAFGFHDVEVTREDSGAPGLQVTGKAALIADSAGVSKWHVSLSHTHSIATAMVMAE